MPTEVAYESIEREAFAFAARYRKEIGVPPLPSGEQLTKYQSLIETKYQDVVSLIKRHLLQITSDGGHGFEHLMDVSLRAGYIADLECEYRQVPEDERGSIIDTAVLTGLLHDIERHRGYGSDHAIEGEKVARRILAQTGNANEAVCVAVLHHDQTDFDPSDDLTISIVYGAVFDADHFRWGLEREDTFWQMKKARQVKPDQVIHDYAFLPPMREIWKTNYGRQVGPQYIDFGLAIAKHVETFFSA